MQLIRNALDPHHIQRPHLNEMNCAFRCDFATLNWGSIEVTMSRSLSNYNILVKCVKLFFHTNHLTY
jgi:hypothetical protein